MPEISPSSLRILAPRSVSVSWRSRLCAAALLCVVTANAEVPGYLREALAKFNPEIPAEWAYTVTTERDGRRTTERFDASLPPDQQWHLLQMDDRAPTPKELADYFKYKASQSPGMTQANFHRNDIDPGSVELLREDPLRAEFSCGFRTESSASDKMLAHLRLRLIVAKVQPHVEKYTLDLLEPYSPVLGVKMRELLVEMYFAPAEAGHPSLPLHSSSHFVGRIFLVPIEENLRYRYSDFAHRP